VGYHLVGVGGIGMSALARLLAQRGAKVSGSDRSPSALLEALRGEGVDVSIGDESEPAPDVQIVMSTAIRESHPIVARSRSQGRALLHRSDLLVELMKGYKPLTVSGSHGKTTTTALLAWILREAGWDPSFALGGLLAQLHTNARHGKGDYFVAEADESDGSFTKYHSYGAIITGIEREHMDHYESEERLIGAFQTFADQVERSDLLFWSADDQRLIEMGLPGQSYGFDESAAIRVTDFRQRQFGILFSLAIGAAQLLNLELPLIGRHNASNAAAAAGLALALGVGEEAVRRGLAAFPGVARRCEKKGEVRRCLVIDDYAHHPTEVEVTLAALRKAADGRRLIVAFQPHRYTRLRDCMEQFATAFQAADLLYVTEVYSAGEEKIEGVTGERLAELTGAEFVSRKEVTEVLSRGVRPHDVVVTLGAGDITEVGGDLIQRLQTNPPRKWSLAVACGGRSTEHEISIISAGNIFDRLDRDLYELEYCLVPRDGDLVESRVLEKFLKSELVFPVFHGPNGEDGMYAALLQAIGVPFIGCNMTAAAVAMDKGLTKRVVESAGIRTAPWVDVARRDWERERISILAEIDERLHLPLYIKPVHFGSTIGIVRVEREEEIERAIDQVLGYDDYAVVEQAILGARDIEFAVLGNDRIEVPPPGEVMTGGRTYDYEGKYGANPMPTLTSTDLSDDKAKEGCHLAMEVYRLLRCDGLSRVDFLLDPSGNYWLNEVNPMPGFTGISLYPKMWADSGLAYPQLLDRLVVLALQRARVAV
jgi:D-alanine-D-alanine ligase/UDP-N-acetylmuramate--alanine ligase